jgi:hypothetical protein
LRDVNLKSQINPCRYIDDNVVLFGKILLNYNLKNMIFNEQKDPNVPDVEERNFQVARFL